MEQLICKSCGAPLVRDVGFGLFKCEYCGSRYQKKYEPTGYQIIEVYHSPVQKVSAKVIVSDELKYHIPAEHLGKICCNELSKSLAHEIAKYMTVSVEEDPFRQQTIVRGDLRLIPAEGSF